MHLYACLAYSKGRTSRHLPKFSCIDVHRRHRYQTGNSVDFKLDEILLTDGRHKLSSNISSNIFFLLRGVTSERKPDGKRKER